MFDLNIVSKRYFTIKIGELVLEVEPPKLKALKKITALSKAKNEDTMDELAEAVGMILSKNKSGHNVPDELIDELDLDQMSQILTAYFEWLSKAKNSPN
ncbi:hypothetical protein [Clostridium tagluense]|uniref:Uncharacterized protein n=1 Tax=Clostridium tagluense TaxID=360422 RepID=A0A401UUA9_9CLOT|nr:hypothetical protein [Clostridium tagluense]GCD13127.1 hypothetical protein Ctaglu_47500 [Clostridium tagluense]